MTGANGEKQDIPDWFNNEFLETALRNGYSDQNLTVTSSEITRATQPGDNYLSIMYRAVVQVQKEGTTQRKHLIVKAEPDGEVLKRLALEGGIFEQETIMLRDILPAMHELLKEAYPDDFTPFSAKYLYFHFGKPAIVLVVEDLKEQGFEMAERTNGLDMDHCLLVIKKMARFHAASVVLFEKQPELQQPFLKPKAMGVIQEEFKDFFNISLTALVEKIEGNYTELKKYIDKLNSWKANGIERWAKSQARNDEDFNVLIHGDLWVNNIMFRYSKEDQHVEDIRFVDYQMNQWTSPAVDLHYFLNSSPSPNILDKQEFFINEYYQILTDAFKVLGYERLCPSLEQINKNIQERGEFGVLSCLSIRSIVLTDKDDVPDLNKIGKGEEEKYHHSNLYLESLKIQLPLLEEKGWL